VRAKNYVQFRNEIRINRACQVLPDSSKSILDVAMHAGFDNLSNFNDQFRRIKGMTPRDYRRRWETQ
jgi:AraC-like DNA-binding protein